MPKIWLSVLLNEKITDKSGTLFKLKYEYTVDDVFDIIEFLDVQDSMISMDTAREESHSGNR